MSNKNLDPKLLKPVATFYQMELESNIFQITDHNSFTIPIELHFKKINHLMAKESNSNESMNINPSEHTAIREPNQYTVQNPQLHQIYGNENLLKSSINQIDETTSISQYSNANPPKRTYGNINLKTDDAIVQPSQRTTSKETNISGLTNLFNRETESVIPIKKSNFDYKTSSTFLNPNYSNEKNYKLASDSGTIRTTISYKFNQVNKVRNPVDEALKKYEEKLQPLKDQINEIKENLKKCKISD